VTRLATIDLGTNTVRLLVVEVESRRWRVLAQAQRITRLGQGQGGVGALHAEPMERTVATVAEFVATAERLGAAHVRIVATSAVREASNREELAARVHAATNRSIEVLSGEAEARLTLLGVAAGLPELGGSFLLFDIGGGSTEFVLAESGRARAAASLRLGVVSLAERFIDAGPVDPARYAAMTREIAGRLAGEIPPALGGVRRSSVLVGTAGTVTTLAALDLGLATYDADRVHGHRLTRPAVERLRDRLGALPLAERAALPCLEPGRADVLIPGIAICLATMERFGFDTLIVSDRGLREGILCEILAAP
jgi:exopolyphosphatase/guanosine-5'-triphosphate,3'-diphosphate pyrophosphatase